MEVKWIRLGDGITRVPDTTKRYFPSHEALENEKIAFIDTMCLYEEFQINEARNYKIPDSEKLVSYWRFYSSGRFNKFSVRVKDSHSPQAFDPLYTGDRGYCYERKGKIKAISFSSVNGMGTFGRHCLNLEFNAGGLTVAEIPPGNSYKYKKVPLIPGMEKFTASW